jgi:parallel beta-helix repeat protein
MERLDMPEKDGLYNIVKSLIVVLILLNITLFPLVIHDLDAPTMVLSELPIRGTLAAGIPHNPIIINGDSNFNVTAQAEGWSGNGTRFNPYIIENLEIDLGGGPGNCISISNTMAYFIIRNCNLTSASANSYSGIYLNNVANGQLTNNQCNLNDVGITTENSHNNTITNNTCSGNAFLGSWIRNANYNTIFDNLYISNEIGIYVEISDFNLIANNSFSNNDFTGIYCIVGGFNTLANNTFTSTGNGIVIEQSSSNIITSNKLTWNNEGIWLWNNANSNTVTNNTCSDNIIAIELDENTNSNDIVWNILERSLGENGYDDGVNNIFDYNYWSDYDGLDADLNGIGDTPYPINGTMVGFTNEDPHPLIFPPSRQPLVWSEKLSDMNVAWNEIFYYDLNVTAYGGVDRWWLNDTSNIDIDQTGIVRNNTAIMPGMFGVQVSVNDTYGNLLTGVFSVTVADTTPPQWLELPIDQIIECGETLHLDLNATDILLDTWWLNDTSHFTIDSQGLLTTLGILPVGKYGVQVWVDDTSDNIASVTFIVTVIDTKPPVWVEIPENLTIVSGQSFICDFNATDPSGIAEWWIDDTVHFIIDWTGRVRTTGTLEQGIYGLRVYVSDIYGHILWAAILVEVTPVSILTTTTTTTTTTMQDGASFAITFIFGLEVCGAVAIVIAFAILWKQAGKLGKPRDSS